MKFRLILIFFLILSCSPHLSTLNKKQPYTAKGFAFIYNDNDFKEKIINSSMNNDILQISHQNLKTGTLLKIINPKLIKLKPSIVRVFFISILIDEELSL